MLIVHLVVKYVHINLCHFLLVSGLATASACGSALTFLFTFFAISAIACRGIILSRQ